MASLIRGIREFDGSQGIVAVGVESNLRPMSAGRTVKTTVFSITSHSACCPECGGQCVP